MAYNDIIMKFAASALCVYYNLLANFYIIANLLFPYYSEDILLLQNKTLYTLECITDCSESTCKKRKRFDTFVDNLIERNNDLIERIKKQEEEDNDIKNYERVVVDTDEDINDDDDDVEIHNDTDDTCEETPYDTVYERDKKNE